MLYSATEQAARADWHKTPETTSRVIALRIPGHHVIYRTANLDKAKAEAARHRSEGRKVTLKWHTETVTAKTSDSPAHGTCSNCSGILNVDCGIACNCGWEIGLCNP